MNKLVLLRHGESIWNAANRFTGWVDVELADQGLKEAQEAGRTLKAQGFDFDTAHTSILKRAIKTLWLVLEEMDRMWLPVHLSWRLNERHYGALQGLNKKETVERFGEEQVKIWRRSYSTPPPAISEADFERQSREERFRLIPRVALPRAEALSDCLVRVLPYWNEVLAPAVRRGERLLVVAHGNSMRALMKHLEGISESEITELNIPTGVPLVYELDAKLQVQSRNYLGDPATIAAKIDSVAKQSSKN